jgi:hypothetical protein
VRLGEFVFVQGDIAEALSYVNRFRKQYLGIEEPYQMRLSAQPPTQTQPFTQPADVLPQSVEEREITNDDQGF